MGVQDKNKHLLFIIKKEIKLTERRIKMEIKNIDEIKGKVDRKLKVGYYYILYALLDTKLNEFSTKDRQTRKDLELLLALRKYFNIGDEKETFNSFAKEIKDNLQVI